MLGLAILPSKEFVRAELGTTGNEETAQLETPKKVVVRKCCKENEILVEVDVGRRVCRLRSNYLAGMVFIMVLEYLCYNYFSVLVSQLQFYHLFRFTLDFRVAENWEPQFYSFPDLNSIPGPRFYETDVGSPICNGHNEYRHRIHEIDPRTDDSFRLLANGSLSFKGNIREFHKERGNLIDKYSSGSVKDEIEDNNATETDVIKEKTCNSSTPKQKSRVLYPPAKYCIDQMVVDYRLVNKTVPPSMDGIILEFATICVHHKVNFGHIIPILKM